MEASSTMSCISPSSSTSSPSSVSKPPTPRWARRMEQRRFWNRRSCRCRCRGSCRRNRPNRPFYTEHSGYPLHLHLRLPLFLAKIFHQFPRRPHIPGGAVVKFYVVDVEAFFHGGADDVAD